MVSPVKIERIRRAALTWLERHPGHEIRFDVVAERAGRIDVLQDAF
jgi:Holliday junction resolvase-like predicted endonuclease